MAQINYRTLNVDAYDPESPLNFPIATLIPASTSSTHPISTSADAAAISQSIRQLLRSGDSLGALTSALETAPLSSDADDATKQLHSSTVSEVLQGIRQSDANRILTEMVSRPGGNSLADTLMKYIYKGMSGSSSTGGGSGRGMSPQGTGSSAKTGFSQIQARNLGEGGGGQAMSVLLSWHEKLVEIVGVGGIVRVMCDRRTV